VDRLILPSTRSHLCIVNIKVCVQKHASILTAIHYIRPQYSNYDPCISVGTLSDLLGCSSPFEHSAITYAWLPGLPHHFLSDGSSQDLSKFLMAYGVAFTESSLACISTSMHSMHFFCIA